MERNVKHLLLRKIDVLKTAFFSERKFEEMHWIWRAKRYKLYSVEHLYWHYCLQLSFVYKTVCPISFKLFCSGDKRLCLFIMNLFFLADIPTPDKNLPPSCLRSWSTAVTERYLPLQCYTHMEEHANKTPKISR